MQKNKTKQNMPRTIVIKQNKKKSHEPLLRNT